MDEIGSILLEAREAKGLTLNEVHEKLRISTKFLSALESGQYDLLPSSTHVKGYLRNYARFLGLDSGPLIERYETVKSQYPTANQYYTPTGNGVVTLTETSAPKTIPPISPVDTGFFNPVNVELEKKRASGGDWSGRLIILALVATIGMIALFFLPRVLGREVMFSAENLSAAVQDIYSGTAEEETAVDGDEPSVQLITPITSTISITPTGRTSGATNTINTPVPTRSPLPATMEIVNLELDITERTWLKVTIDGVVEFEGQAEKGEALSWSATQSANLRTGNAAGVFVRINEIDLGILGGRGQVIDETWETTQ